MNVGDVYPEEGVRNPRFLRPVREVAVDDDERDEREDNAISQGVKSYNGSASEQRPQPSAPNLPMKVS